MNLNRVALVSAIFAMSLNVAHASCPEHSTGSQCKRVEEQLSRWDSSVLKKFEIEVVGTITGDGFCAYNQESEVVELTGAAFKLDDEAFAQCLGRALAQARYEQVEEKWIADLGGAEAWIVRKGVLTKVSVPAAKTGKLETSMARQVWVSLATQELLTKTRNVAAQVGGDRTIASVAKPSSDKKQELLQELLGI